MKEGGWGGGLVRCGIVSRKHKAHHYFIGLVDTTSEGRKGNEKRVRKRGGLRNAVASC